VAGDVGDSSTHRVAGFMKNRLKVLRAERDWSQSDLAERLGISRQSVNAIETGRYDPSLPLAFKISAIFALKIEEIFSAAD
jgi:putative transcriptional regulator